MPDPGEPYPPDPPDPDDYASIADYLDAIEAFTARRLSGDEMKIRRETIMGLIKLEKFLEAKAEDS